MRQRENVNKIDKTAIVNFFNIKEYNPLIYLRSLEL